MAEDKKAPPKAKPDPAPEPELALAGSSSDPAVHQLIAERQTAHLNGNDKAADAATAQLKKLGYK